MNTGGATFNLGNAPVWQVGGKVGYALTSNFEATGTLGYKEFSYGSSPMVALSYEPKSVSRETTALIGIAWHP